MTLMRAPASSGRCARTPDFAVDPDSSLISVPRHGLALGARKATLEMMLAGGGHPVQRAHRSAARRCAAALYMLNSGESCAVGRVVQRKTFMYTMRMDPEVKQAAEKAAIQDRRLTEEGRLPKRGRRS
jgi:hypothetical protein